MAAIGLPEQGSVEASGTTSAGSGVAPTETPTLTLTPSGLSNSINPGSLPSDATSFTLYRSTSSGAEVSFVTGITSFPYVDSGLTSGTTYYYKGAWVNATGTGAQSAEVSQLATAGGASAVTGVTITGGSQNAPAGANLALAATVQGSGPPSQAVYWTRTGHGAIDTLTGVYTPPAAGKAPKISLIKALSVQDPTKFDTIFLTTPALAVGNMTLSAAYLVSLSWGAVAGATAYKLYRDGNPVPIYTGTNLTYTDSILAGLTATYTITSTVGGVESAPSLPQTVGDGAFFHSVGSV